jgi:hypothetical protein
MEFQISLEGRTVVAQPRPEDQASLDELLGSGRDVTIGQSDADTEGHALAADEITVDVEGHAMTLRLPHAGDAAALRRALAVGTLTASVAIGGFVAGTVVSQSADPLTAPATTSVTGQTGSYAISEKGGQTSLYATSEKGAQSSLYATSEKGEQAGTGAAAGTGATNIQAPDKPQQGPSGHQGPRRE